MFDMFSNLEHEVSVLLALAVILCAGFLVTRLTKMLHLPNVSGYILAGIFIGPHFLHIIPEALADNMDFVADIALAFIAFGVGKFLKKTRSGQQARASWSLRSWRRCWRACLSRPQCFYFLILTGSLRSFLAPSQRQPHLPAQL